MENGFDLSQLQPEEIQQLVIHVVQSNEELTASVDKLSQVIEMMMEKMSEHDEHINKLDDVVMNEIIGGVEALYQKNVHDTSLDEIKAKYADLFDPHMDALKEIFPDVDVYEEILNERNGFGDDQEGFDGRVNEVASALKSKLDKIRGVPAADDIVAEEAPVEMPAVEVPAEDDMVSTIKKMKSRKNPLSMA